MLFDTSLQPEQVRGEGKGRWTRLEEAGRGKGGVGNEEGVQCGWSRCGGGRGSRQGQGGVGGRCKLGPKGWVGSIYADVGFD